MKYTIDVNELAAALGLQPRSILNFRAGLQNPRMLQGLPDPIQGRPLMWLRADIEAWLASKSTFNPAAPAPEPPRRRGRPRKNAAGEKGGA